MQESNNFFLQDFVTPPAYTSEDSAFDLTDLEVLLTQYFLSVFFSHFPRFLQTNYASPTTRVRERRQSVDYFDL